MERFFEEWNEEWKLVEKKQGKEGYEVYDYSNLLENILNYNLIGLDYGDGEFSAYSIRVIEDEEAACGYKIDLTPLRFERGDLHPSPPTTFYRYKDEKSGKLAYKLLIDGNIESARERGAEVYSNFKKCPEPGEIDGQNGEINGKYIFEDGNQSDWSYKEVMARGFNLVINVMLKYNNIIDPKNKTIVLVGCPSSSAWVGVEHEYAEILKGGLEFSDEVKEMGFSEDNLYIAIHKESNAAMAQAMNLHGGGRIIIQPGKITVIIDNGSSTIDITVIGANGIVAGGEDSYQFGGNTLDENLVKLIKEALRVSNMTLKDASGHKIAMRTLKENGYGDKEIKGWTAANWNSDLPYTLNATVNDKENRVITIHIEYGNGGNNGNNIAISMSEALRGVSCKAYHLVEAMGTILNTAVKPNQPWLDMLRTIYTQFYNANEEQFKDQDAFGNKKPDNLILCGGVSMMPEVRKTAEEVFHCPANLSDEPKFAVSKGLADILGVEVIKALSVQKIENKVKEDMSARKAGLKEHIVKCGADAEWRFLMNTLGKWKKPEGNKSINDLIALYQENYTGNYNEVLGKGAEDWYTEPEGIRDLIQAYMTKYFSEIFGGYVQAFDVRLPDMKFNNLGLNYVDVVFDSTFFFGVPQGEETYDTQLSDESKARQRDRVWRNGAYDHIEGMKDKICQGGSVDVNYKKRESRTTGHFWNKSTIYYDSPATTYCHFDGYESSYENALTDDVMNDYIDLIFEEIRPHIAEHVERITPYFVTGI